MCLDSFIFLLFCYFDISAYIKSSYEAKYLFEKCWKVSEKYSDDLEH